MQSLLPDKWLQNHGERIGEIFFRPLGNIPQENLGRQAPTIGTWKGAIDRLGDIHSPALLLTGTEDRLVPPPNALFLNDNLPRTQLALIKHGGHGLMFQNPDRFCETVLDFLE